MLVVDHDLMAVAHAHRAHPRDELLGRRRHMRQIRAIVGDIVDVEEARTGDVLGVVGRLRIPLHLRQEPRSVQNAQVGVLQMGSKPIRRYERFRVIHRHAPLLPVGIA